MLYLVYELFYDWVAFYGVFDTEEAAILCMKNEMSRSSEAFPEIRAFTLNKTEEA